jgi:AraC-like DNA-binding protein
VGSFVIAFMAALAGAALVAAALLVSERRTRREVTRLMERIDELQGRLAADGEAATDSALARDAASRPEPAATGDVRDFSRDVLAGRTSFVRRAVAGEPGQPASLAGQAIALVHARIGDNLLPAELAEDLSVSLRTLERGLASELRCSPRQLILALKMREARRLLENGRMRVNEVASQLGYATPSHFSRTFRTFYRVPPSDVAREPRPRPAELDH